MLLGFKERFKLPIQVGTKVLTMRKRRKVRPKIGEQLHMYTGLHTPRTKLISKAEKLISIQNARVLINEWPASSYGYLIRIYIDGRLLLPTEVSEFVKYDGFADELDFCRYWLSIPGKKRLKTRTAALMEIYNWTDLKY